MFKILTIQLKLHQKRAAAKRRVAPKGARRVRAKGAAPVSASFDDSSSNSSNSSFTASSDDSKNSSDGSHLKAGRKFQGVCLGRDRAGTPHET